MHKAVRSIITSWVQHKNTRASAAIAFYTIFSITPLLAIGVGVTGIFINKIEAKQEIVAQIAKIASPEAASVAKTVLNNFKVPDTGRLASFFLVILLIYSASMVFDELRNALNSIFGAKKHEDPKEQLLIFLKARLVSGLFAFSAGLLVVLNFFISTFLTIIEKLTRFFPQFKIHHKFIWIAILNQGVSFVVVSLIFFCFYRFLPRKRPEISSIVPGVIFSAFMFEAGKYFLKLYLTQTMVTSSFGAGGTIVAAIVWVYYSVQIVLLGAELSNYLDKRKASARHRLEQEKKHKPVVA